MINKRTRTTADSGALSGFAQDVGYALAGLGPLSSGSCTNSAAAGQHPLPWLLMTNQPPMLEDEVN